MGHESVEAVRQPISVGPAARRRLQESVAVHVPSLLALVVRALLKLRPDSRLRRAFVRRVVQLGIEAANRRDYEAAFGLYDARVELVVPHGLTAVGFEPLVHGRDDRLRFEQRWRAEWGDFSYAPQELIDLGTRILVAGRVTGSGPASGAAFEAEWAALFTVSAGRVVHEHVFLDRAEAYAAVGLPRGGSTNR